MKSLSRLIILLLLSTAFLRASDPFGHLAPVETEQVPLRLEEGERVEISVDVGEALHKTNPRVGGVAMTSLSRWSEGTMPFSMETGEYSLPKPLEDAFIAMRLPTTRFFAITQEEPFDNLKDALDAVALFVDKIHIPQDRVILELENLSANSTYTPQEWADAVRHCLNQQYGFRFWEIGNEVYSSIWGSTGKAFPTPDDYIQHFIEVSKAIKAVQPEALVGISVPRSHRLWGDAVLEAAAGHYDFASPHFYGGFFNIDKAPFEEVVIDDNHMTLQKIVDMNRLLKDLNPGREIFIYDTEWGLHGLKQSDDPTEAPGKADFQPRNGNIMGTVYRAVRLVYYARENLLRGACGWKSLTRPANPGFATLYYTEPERRTMLYWLYYYFNRTLLENVAAISGTTPYHGAHPLVPVVATRNADGTQVTLMLVNGSWERAFPASISLEDFTPEKHKAVILSHDDLDAFPHLDKKSDFVNAFPVKVSGKALEFDLPAHSIVFIEISGRSSPAPARCP